MEVNVLNPDEFEVECVVRDIKGDAVVKLTTLKKTIDDEVSMPVLKPYKAHSAARSAPQRELRRCALKIKEQREWITSLTPGDTTEPKELLTVESRLLHVQGRLERLLYSTKTYKGQCREHLNLLGLVLTAVHALKDEPDNLDKTLEQIKTSSQDDPEELSTSEDEESPKVAESNKSPSGAKTQKASSKAREEEERDVHEAARLLSSTILSPSTSSHSAQRIDKWKISFNGDSRELAVERFLFRVEHQASNYGISNEDLVHQLGILLKGAALNWYWCHIERHPKISWNSLKAELIERFQDRRTEHDIRRSLEARKQRSNECFRTFYNDIIALSLQFRNPLPDSELLHIVRRNMRKGFQNALADQEIFSIASLVRRCLALEDTWNRTGYEPEKLCARKYVDEIDYDESEGATLHVDEINYRQRREHASAQPRATNFQSASKEMVICWNCQDIGHVFNDCPKPAKMFCFGCGRQGVVKPNCFRCSGNLSQRVRIAGTPIPSAPPRVTVLNREPTSSQEAHPK